MNNQDVQAIIDEFVKTDVLKRHLTAVSAAMRYYAGKYGEDEEKWSQIGLLHDFDWDLVGESSEHPFRGANILKERGFPEDVIHAVLSHGDDTGVTRENLMEKVLYAVDELSGFVIAVALVRPSKSLADVEPRSVTKKMKDKAFARAVKREDIVRGAEDLGVDLNEHIANVIEALKPVSADLGLGPVS